MVKLSKFASTAALAATTAFMPTNSNASAVNCGPEELTYIPEVTAHVEFKDGTSEDVSLWTERRPWGRNSGILIDEGQRAMPLERKDVESVKFSFPKNVLYNNGTGVKMFGTALIGGAETDITRLLDDYQLSPAEMDSLGGELNAYWKAAAYLQDKKGASLEGVLDLDKTITETIEKTIEVPVEVPGKTVTDTLFVEVPVEKDEKSLFATAGYTTGPNETEGVYLTLGADRMFGSRLGASITAGYLGSNSQETSSEHLIEHTGENRLHKFSKQIMDDNEALIKLGGELALNLGHLHLEAGGGVYLGDVASTQYREIAITDIDGNLIGTNNPVSDEQILESSTSTPYFTAGARLDLGKGWLVEGAYQRFGGENTKGNGFNAGLGRRF